MQIPILETARLKLRAHALSDFEACFSLWSDPGVVQYIGGKPSSTPSISGIPELGWALSPDAQGKGYATEALRAVIKWGDQSLKSTKSVCLIHPENSPSIRVAEKLGYFETVQTSYAGRPIALFSRKKI